MSLAERDGSVFWKIDFGISLTLQLISTIEELNSTVTQMRKPAAFNVHLRLLLHQFSHFFLLRKPLIDLDTAYYQYRNVLAGVSTTGCATYR